MFNYPHNSNEIYNSDSDEYLYKYYCPDFEYDESQSSDEYSSDYNYYEPYESDEDY